MNLREFSRITAPFLPDPGGKDQKSINQKTIEIIKTLFVRDGDKEKRIRAMEDNSGIAINPSNIDHALLDNLNSIDTNHLTNAQVSGLHARSHAITSTADHTSSATPGAILKADANGLPVDSIISEAAGVASVNGDLDLVGNKINNVNAVQFDITPAVLPASEGLLQWNSTDGTLNLGMQGGDVTMQLGQEMFAKVRNDSGGTIPNGQAVYVSGRTGVYPDVKLARSDVDSTSRIIGVATEDILNTGSKFGYVTTVGYVRGIKTNYSGAGIWGTTWVAGDLLYVSKTNAGILTNVEPTAPHHSDVVGTVAIVHGTLGSMLVTLDRHKTLEELTDVNGTALTTNGQFPSWNNATKYFDFDKKITDYSLSSHTHSKLVASDDSPDPSVSCDATGQTSFISNIIMPKAAGTGILVEGATYGWKDLLGSIETRPAAGGGAPAIPDFIELRTGVWMWRFGTLAPNNHLHEAFLNFHIPHDLVPNSDIYLHAHWAQNVVDTGGAAGVPGVAKWYFDISYADGHGTAGGAADPFTAIKTVSVTQQASTTQYGHMIAELAITSNGGSATLFDRNTITVDGIFTVRIYRDPADGADTLNQDSFVPYVDIHYQTTQLGTKNKAPNFYT